MTMDCNMNTYEYSVVPEEIDFKGQITVPSLCGHVINAIAVSYTHLRAHET